MAMISYNGIKIKCPNCGEVQTGKGYYKTGLFDLQMHIRYSNQHGAQVRLFCKTCKAVHDVTVSYKSGHKHILKQSWTVD